MEFQRRNVSKDLGSISEAQILPCWEQNTLGYPVRLGDETIIDMEFIVKWNRCVKSSKHRFQIGNMVHAFLRATPFITDRIRSMAEGYVFTGVCHVILSTEGGSPS